MPRTTRNFPFSGLMVCAFLALAAGAAGAQSGPPPGGPPPGGAPSGPPDRGLPTATDAVNPKNDTEPDRVNEIYFYGNTKVPTATLLAGIGVKPGDVMAPAKMGNALDFVVAQYKAQGLNVLVRPRVSHPRQNFVNLNFLIDEQGKGGHD